MINSSTKGIALAAVAGLSWGSMAVAGQYLLTGFNFAVTDLVCARLLGAGILMLLISYIRTRALFKGLDSWRNWISLLIYGAALLFTQYSFFAGIALTNAGTAAMIVAIGPAIVLMYLHFAEGRPLTVCEVSCVAIAFLGVVLLGTKGDIANLVFSAEGLFWCVASACCGAFSTLFSRHLIKAVGVENTVGWAMTVAGVVAIAIYGPWQSHPVWTPSTIFFYAYIIFIGTVVAFWTFLESLRYIAASVASLVACLEPLSGFVLSVLLLSVVFSTAEIIGATMILVGIVWLSWPKKNFNFK